jgi:hypothetical protein
MAANLHREEVNEMSKRRATRLSLTVSREMTIALEILASKTNLGITTQAMVLLRQALDRTISSEAVQYRVKQDRAFQTRDEWLADTTTDTFVANALLEAGGKTDETEPGGSETATLA